MSSKDLYDLLDDLEAIFQHPGTLGFAPLVDELRNVVAGGSSNYPPRNIIRTDVDTWMLEVALAGFSAHEISVEEYAGCLYIAGRSTLAQNSAHDYAYHGIARRDFSINTKLGEHVKVVGEPIMQHGILIVTLKREVPEAAKRKTFTVKAINEDGSELVSREPAVSDEG